MPYLIVYHKNCSDGIMAAWIAKKSLHDKVNLQGMLAGHNIIIDNPSQYTKIYFVDCCPLKEDFEKLNNVIIIDHHISNYILYHDYEHFHYNENLSGCQLVYVYFDCANNPNLKNFEWFINYIADRDLWTFNLPNSRQICAGLYVSKLITFHNLELLYKCLNGETIELSKTMIKFNLNIYNLDILKNQILLIGISTEEATKKIIDDAVYHSVLQKFCGYNVWVSDSYHKRSEVGEALCNKRIDGNLPDFALIYKYDLKTKEWWISLRALPESPLDLTVVLKKFNVGGHAKACGFTHKGNISKLFD